MDDANNAGFTRPSWWRRKARPQPCGRAWKCSASRACRRASITDRGSHHFFTPKAGEKVDARIRDPGRPRARAAGDRAYPGLFARGAGPIGAHVRHPAGPAAEGAEACRDQRDRRRQPISFATSTCRGIMRVSPSRRALCESAFVVSPTRRCFGRSSVSRRSGIVARDNTVAYAGRRLQLPQSRVRAHYVKARVKVREYPDGALAVFHGPQAAGTL